MQKICIMMISAILILPSILAQHPVEHVLDQKQENYTDSFLIYGSIWIAQSFKPSMTPLVKVEIMVRKMYPIESPLIISIRDNLTGNDLTYRYIPGSQVPYFTNWIEIDFPDIEVTPGKTYYIVVRSRTSADEAYQWLYVQNESTDFYKRGKLWMSFDKGENWICDEEVFQDCTFRTYSYRSIPDLECEGYLNWSDVRPGNIVNGTFYVMNVGTPLSYLNWSIYSWPMWGKWNFSTCSGSKLRPEDGPFMVRVRVIAPESYVPRVYTGEIKIVNQNDKSDYCIIKARLVIPKKYLKERIWEILTSLPIIGEILKRLFNETATLRMESWYYGR